METALPAGTITFCFTDLEASTTLLKQVGEERFAEVLLGHRTVVREVFGRLGGVEVDTQGDAFFYVFPEAGQALAACAEVQEADTESPVRVRIGLHTGSARLTSDGYVGEDLHLAARIAAAGHGGQVLVSAATRALVSPGELLYLGEHRLKDFAQPIALYQLGQRHFPPLKTISNTNLPRPASTFVGRARERQEVGALLSGSARFVTLTGAGGSGKTRLAVEVASELVPTFKAGVFWVGLGSVRDSALVMETIAETLGAKFGLSQHVGDRDLLLVIDNVEQVASAAPELASLVEECPNLRILATSRELLRVRGELEYAVPPLERDEAVALFCERSRLPPDETILLLCRRLDNLPLAVELASARSAVLSPKQILDRLSRRLDLLKGGRDAEARQQTLRATFDWSYDLLFPEEQQLFARLSVFAGGCSIEAAEEVADGDIDVLQSLVEKSLLRYTRGRFWMLESIRQYATDRLEAFGETDLLARRHADYFLALSAEAEPEILGISPQEWLDRLEIEHDNLRAALDWLEATGQTQRALTLGGSIWEFWCLRGHYVEGWRRLEGLTQLDEQPTLARAKALTGAVHLAGNAGVPDSLEALRAKEALALHRTLNDAWGSAYARFQLARVAEREGDLEGALGLAEEAAEELRRLGDEHHALQAMEQFADFRLRLSGPESAKPIYEELLSRARAAKDTQIEARALTVFAQWASDESRHVEALGLTERVYELDSELGDPNETVMDFVHIARAMALAGRPATAIRLLTGAEGMREEVGFPFPPSVARLCEEVEQRAQRELDAAALAEARTQGRGLTREDAAGLLSQVLGQLQSRQAAESPPPRARAEPT